MRAIKLFIFAAAAAQFICADSTQRDAGIAAFNAGRYSTALQQLTAAAADKTDSIAQLFLALTQAETGDCKSALPFLIREPLGKLGGIAAVK